MRPFGTAGLVRSHERGGYDIDARALSVATQAKARRARRAHAGHVAHRLGGARDHQLRARRSVDGVPLGEQLDRATRGTATGLRFDLTPFTSITSAIEIEKIRFAHVPLRDANSFRFAPVVQFTKGAIIEGEASAGFRDFRPLDARLAPYRGFVASVKLGFTLLNVTRVEAQARTTCSSPTTTRSRSISAPAAASHVAQRVAGPFEAIVIGGRQRLRYQSSRAPSFDGRRRIRDSGGRRHRRPRERAPAPDVHRRSRAARIATARVRRDYDAAPRLRVRQLHALRHAMHAMFPLCF